MSEDKKLSILVLTSTYARSHQDPQVPWMRETNNRLKSLGHQVEVLAPSFESLPSHEIDGIKVNRFRYAPKQFENLTHDSGAPNKVRSPLVKLLTIPYIISGFITTTWMLIRKRPDIIKIHWPFPHGLMGWFGARLTKTKIVSVCHGAELTIVRGNKPLEKVLSWCLKHSDLVYCNSSHTKSKIREITGPDFPVDIITYGSTLKESPEPKAQPKSEDPLILSCGRVIERKGYPYLIKAMPLVLEKYPKAKLVITGDGGKRAECAALIQELKLSDSVRMAGYVSNEELGNLYRDCTLYAHPSIVDCKGDTEGLGVVLIEALSNRKPVIASEVGGIVDVIKDQKSGILVPEKDSDALAQEIISLLDDPEAALELGEQAYRFAQDHFSWDRIISDLSDLLLSTSGVNKSKHHESVSSKNSNTSKLVEETK